MRRFLLFFLFLISVDFAFGQAFAPSPIVKYNEDLKALCKNAEKPKELLGGLSSKEKKKAKELFEGRSEFLISLMESGYFIFDNPIRDYLNSITDKMVEANPALNPDFFILLSRSNDINAFSIGNGVLVVNLGLINQVKSVDELAFVMGHELSHDVAAHSDEYILAEAKAATNKQRAAEIKKILKSKYRVYSQLKEYVLPGMMAQMQYSREKEFDADSMGMYFARNAGFTVTGAIGCLNMLDISDDEVYEASFDWHAYAAQHSCVIHPYWDSDSDQSSLGSFEVKKEDYIDRLKSHPDCADRIEAIKANFAPSDSSAVELLRNQFEEIKEMAEYEIVASGLASNDYGYALYHGIQQLRLDSADSYMRGLVAYIFADLAYKKSTWKAGNVLSPPDLKNQPSDYYDFLSVIWELSHEETGCVATNLWNACQEDLPEEWNMAISALVSYAQEEKDAADESASKYINQYPNGRFAWKMNKLLLRK